MINRQSMGSLLVVTYLSFFCWSGSALADTNRTWTSRDGTATLEARFHKIQGNEITLILPNGRSQIVKREFLSDADLEWIAGHQESAEAAPAAATGASPTAAIPKALKNHLVNADGESVELGANGGIVPKFYLFYYSASWCGPCVAFTPDLIRDYKRAKSTIPELEVVLVPSDRSAEESAAYMKDYRMPWLGLKFSDTGIRGVPGNPTQFIPALRLTDADGKDILTSETVSRDDFMREAVKLLRASSN